MKLIEVNGKRITAKQYLRQIYHISESIKRLEGRRDDLRKDLYSLKSPPGSMDADKVQTSMSGDSMLRLICKVDEAEQDLLRTIDRLIDLKNHIASQIEALDDERYKTVLLKRYVLLEDWEPIADEMYYTTKWVYALHGQALTAFAEKYGI